ncbi:hypothetical protein Catovirus_1_184 [Catovirus CTV1]|uniref:Uncharacterized protein n=1 Tax=Catovirus CTV1 TaxID=1977631 RepID=A0A1V0S8V2_9VIRU|nr:hypothetical protein Catovirus_1_184 [Catovirus CTV1]
MNQNDIDNWLYNLKELSKNNDFIDDVINLFDSIDKNISKKYWLVIDRKDVTLYDSLDAISSRKNVLIALDTEFQSVFLEINGLTSNKGKTSLVRELGMMFFIKVNYEWILIGSMLLNFPSLFLNNLINTEYMNLNLPDYLTVSDETLEEIKNRIQNMKIIKTYNNLKKQIEEIKNMNIDQDQKRMILNNKFKELNNINTHEIVFNGLDDIDKQLFTEVQNLYWNDYLVKKRTLDENEIKIFLDTLNKVISKSCIIVKSNMDLLVLNNSVKFFLNPQINILIDNTFMNPLGKIYDIDVFMGIFARRTRGTKGDNIFTGSSLKDMFNTSYNNSLSVLHSDSKLNVINKIFNKVKSHNPLSDAYMTFYVAVYINMIVIHSLLDGNINNMKGGSNKYQKYKSKYINLKKKISLST